jgi:ribosome recycling factor
MAIIMEGDLKQFEAEVNVEMDKAVKHFEHDLLAIRSGKASAAMVEDLTVECYGDYQKLKSVASILTPDARMIVIQPWDKTLNGEVFKAIQNSNLGVTPLIDGDIIRVQLPIMSSDRRDELVKVLKKKLEDAKIKIRNLRRDYNSVIKDHEKKSTISEDFAKRVTDHLQKITDSFVDKLDAIGHKKETELKLV